MYEKILVALDGSALAEEVIPHVADIARHTGSEIILLRVSLCIQPRDDEGILTTRAEREQEKNRTAIEYMHYLNGVAHHLRVEGLKVRVAVDFGYPAERIIDFALEEKVSLIAMTTRGRTGISRWVHGSVAARVLEAATVPILLIRSKASE